MVFVYSGNTGCNANSVDATNNATPLTATSGVSVRAAHVNELRKAIEEWHTAKGITSRSFQQADLISKALAKNTSFNGTTEYITLGPVMAPVSSGWHIRFRATWTVLGNLNCLFDLGNGSLTDTIKLTNGFDMLGSHLYFTVYTGTTLTFSLDLGALITSSVSDEFVLSYDAQVRLFQVFKNNVEVYQATLTAAIPYTNRTSCYVGKSNYASDGLFQGYISYLYFNNYPWSQSTPQVLEMNRVAHINELRVAINKIRQNTTTLLCSECNCACTCNNVTYGGGCGCDCQSRQTWKSMLSAYIWSAGTGCSSNTGSITDPKRIATNTAPLSAGFINELRAAVDTINDTTNIETQPVTGNNQSF